MVAYLLITPLNRKQCYMHKHTQINAFVMLEITTVHVYNLHAQS